MSRRTKATWREHVSDNKHNESPFWQNHLMGLTLIGIIVVTVALITLSITDWGRAALLWLGIAGSLVMAVWLFSDPWRSWRRGDPTIVRVGEALAAFGWSVVTVSLAVGIPYVFWRGEDAVSGWAFVIPGAGAVLGAAVAFLGLQLETRRPLPALDRTPRSAKVLYSAEDAEGRQILTVLYRGHDDNEHKAELADVIDDSWQDRFTRGTTWQVYAFRDPMLADSVVFLTEQHHDIWRSGYKLDGVRLGSEGGPVKPGRGSPFFRSNSKRKFES